MNKLLSVIIPVYNQELLVIRALNSIPAREDIEIIVVDDCSTDNTLLEVRTYQMNSDKDIVVLHNEENKGVGYTVNRGYDVATGEYIVLLGSDDYFYTHELNEILNTALNGIDLVYFNLQINNGDIWEVTPETKTHLCGSVKFMRREFIGDTRCPELRWAEDKAFYKNLLAKNPSEVFTGKTIKHYNFPRENSLCYLENKKR